jgi:hypothetical protein
VDKEIQEFTKAIGAVEPQPGTKYYAIFKSMFRNPGTPY